MIEAPLAKNEPQRLAALRKLQILDTPVEERFERITRMVCHLLDVPISSFTLVDEFRQWFKSIQGLTGVETPRGIAFCSHAILSDDILVVADAKEDKRFVDNPLVTGAPYIASYAGFPVRSSDGHRIGTVCAIDRKPRHFTHQQQQLLRDVGAMAEAELRLMELSVSHQQLMHELDAAERLALIDSLTRIWNRAGIMKIMEREWSEAARLDNSFGILSVDIDHFKRVNDTHGHPAGDVVIRETARRLLTPLRSYDAVGRMGGEEFLIILPGCEQDALDAISKRILQSMRSEAIKIDNDLSVPVTVSIGGIIVFPAKGYSIEATLSVADKALYRAKENGRNRSEIESFGTVT